MKTNNIKGTGEAINRVDGRLKVTGQATYAGEFSVKNKVYAQGVNSTIAKGKITSIDVTEALAQPGVIEVITYQNALKLKGHEKDLPAIDNTTPMAVLQSPDVHYYGEYVALVVAETIEQAQYACRLVKIEYAKEEALTDFAAAKSTAIKPAAPEDYFRGDVEKGLAEADETLEVTYVTPIEHHHPMELHTAIATWMGDEVEIYASQQMIDNSVKTIANTFDIPEKNIRVISPFIGGGFGSKLQTHRHVTLAVMAAKMTGRPVHVTVTRTQMFTNTTMRQRNEQKMRLGATKDGKLTALAHETLSHTSTYEQYQEPCGTVSKMLYATPNNEVKHRLMPLNLQTPFAMRAPGEAPGSFALESAMDEMAWKLGMDPIEFRIKNDTQTDPSNGKPFSSRLLNECLRIGADKMGWENRPKTPRSRREGSWLVGYGVSAASRASPYQESAAKVILRAKGGEVHATVQTDATDIGTGTYSILAQTAAEYLQIPIERITVELGDSRFPVTPGSGGSWGAASFSMGVKVACDNVLKELKEKVGMSEDAQANVAQLLLDNNLATFEATGTATPDEGRAGYSVFSFGANFTEVWVNEHTGMFRIKRMVNVSSAGKILNPKTAYGQILGGLTMGAGMVIAEQTKVEPNFGNFITRSFADYHVPVNLDMANVEVIFLPEEDKIANAMGIKGVGELGITGVASAIANAIFNATGKRFRDLPITPEKMVMAEVEAGVV
ncbi:xanthine dehydrogenase family protein molybdopterin-binding subunit [Neolewinella antarctica]|uniref:Xanthine dehydrogenase YagR molybdenum-binding subunit n=1 Tax=Neolewinella antarctica TaxID=442734 RepID=A0ABX0X8V8_9BACT|nr:xanthine dehydrogenase family protein molybdopterin-binding subunit [Neolewinella antarctica]NJC25661.1 xanthine dehydrogenase YagR molybdenum-binding subunit [Neolewinella antarctica]